MIHVVRARRSLCNVALLALLSLAGCMRFESLEQRQVRIDRERMRHGQPLKYHKDTIALSEHAMDLRMGVQARNAKPSKLDLYGEGAGQFGAVMPAGATYPAGAPGGVYPAGGFYPDGASGYPAGAYPMGPYPTGAFPAGAYPAAGSPVGVYPGTPGPTATEPPGPDPTLR